MVEKGIITQIGPHMLDISQKVLIAFKCQSKWDS